MDKKAKTGILPEDEADFKQKIAFLKKDSKINVLCSFTYITPNYDVIATLSELYNFTKNMNSKVYLVMWDMNTLANPYFKKYCANIVKDQDLFIEEKMQEVRGIAKAIGFDEHNLLIFKSSDFWRRLVSFKEENLFQQFFSVLARLHVADFNDFRKCSHIFQISLDVFLSNYFNRLYLEDGDEEIDVIFSDYYKQKLYLATRKVMVEEGLMKNKLLFLLMETVPYIVYDERVPEWNMKLEEIRYILMHAPNKTEDLIQLLQYLDGEKKIEKNISKEKIIENLAKQLYEYLSKYKKQYFEKNKYVEESVMNISKKSEAIKVDYVLKSKIFLDIILLADGTKSTGQIAKHLKKSVATVSSYSSKLKKMGFIRIDKDGKLKRNVKGVKINFELGF